MNKRKLGLVLALSIFFTTSISVEALGFSGDMSILMSEGGDGGNDNGNGGNGGDDGEQITPPTSNIQSKDLIISSVTTEEEIIEPGSPFTLTFKLENISGAPVYGTSLKIVNVEGKGTLDKFMPVGTTNEIYVGSIAKNDIKYVSITLASDPNIKAGVHNFVTSVMFNEKGEKEEEITKVVGVMIQNTPSLSISGITPMESMVSAAIRNDSKTKIKNVKAVVSIDGETFEQNIGSIDVDGEEYMDIPVPNSDVEREAEINITYEDNSGKEYSTSSSCIVPPMVEVQEEVPKTKLGLISFIKSVFGF